jgi:hypothetical protein
LPRRLRVRPAGGPGAQGDEEQRAEVLRHGHMITSAEDAAKRGEAAGRGANVPRPA